MKTPSWVLAQPNSATEVGIVHLESQTLLTREHLGSVIFLRNSHGGLISFYNAPVELKHLSAAQRYCTLKSHM
jgi:hypothetical protein